MQNSIKGRPDRYFANAGNVPKARRAKVNKPEKQDERDPRRPGMTETNPGLRSSDLHIRSPRATIPFPTICTPTLTYRIRLPIVLHYPGPWSRTNHRTAGRNHATWQGLLKVFELGRRVRETMRINCKTWMEFQIGRHLKHCVSHQYYFKHISNCAKQRGPPYLFLQTSFYTKLLCETALVRSLHVRFPLTVANFLCPIATYVFPTKRVILLVVIDSKALPGLMRSPVDQIWLRTGVISFREKVSLNAVLRGVFFMGSTRVIYANTMHAWNSGINISDGFSAHAFNSLFGIPRLHLKFNRL